ncbi:hypothetical protein C5S53_15615 [Methanophagales archaeon]|nr:hypothetical protein C5S53_15615 [Methanophagales archaeon]
MLDSIASAKWREEILTGCSIAPNSAILRNESSLLPFSFGIPNLAFPYIIQPLTFVPLSILLIASARFTPAAPTATIAATIEQRKCKHKRHHLNYLFPFFHNAYC